MSRPLGFAIGAVLPLLASAVLTCCAVTSSPSAGDALADRPAEPALDIPLAPSAAVGDANEMDEMDEAVDLFGNPVTTAVAKYKFDATGSLYEVHSPQTELPRLAPPRS